VEKEGWFVDWGFLVLLDRKLLAVDGAHKLSLSNWAALAEAERSGVVSIAKAAKNTAYARTRQIKIANPVDREADKYSTKSLSAFLYPCQALTTILDKTSIARLDLAVFADQHDVAPEEINKVQAEEPEPELCFLAEALKWCWSSQAQIEFTMEAANIIHEEAIGLYRTFFYDEIPLCSIDMKWKLARLSAALAFLTLTTEDYTKITVTKEHVELVAQFIREEYSKAGLNILAQTERHETLTLEDVETLLLKIEGQLADVVDVETVCDVLKFFVIRGRATRDEVMAKFGLAETKQLRPLLATLTSEGLIKARRGFYPEPKLIQAYKASEGFNFTKLTKVTKAEKEPPKNLEENKRENEKNDPSFSDLGKLGNLGKMERLGPMDNS
jgi:transcription initiation factor IIE alpha subunit